MKFLAYNECEDIVLYTGESKELALIEIQNHLIDGYSLSDVQLYLIEKDIPLRATAVTVIEDN